MLLNPYKALLDLLPDNPLLVGTVVLVGADSVRVEQLGGGLHVLRGEATLGQKVYFRDGVIEGIAPDLTIENIEV